jgi:hypothetical protein
MADPHRLLAGAAAGAAGTTALNLVTYLDMALRGRGSSSTPEDTVESVSEKTHVPIPGDDETRSNRISGLGALMGLVVGICGGAALGWVDTLGLRAPVPVTAALVGAGVMAGTDAPMTGLGISDPRSWSAGDWLSDLLPHAAYGVVTAWTFRQLTDPQGG